MNASKIIDEEMSLDEKLAAIDTAMANATAEAQKVNPNIAPLDPADLTMCIGCQ